MGFCSTEHCKVVGASFLMFICSTGIRNFLPLSQWFLGHYHFKCQSSPHTGVQYVFCPQVAAEMHTGLTPCHRVSNSVSSIPARGFQLSTCADMLHFSCIYQLFRRRSAVPVFYSRPASLLFNMCGRVCIYHSVLYVHAYVYVVCIPKEEMPDVETWPWAHSHSGP